MLKTIAMGTALALSAAFSPPALAGKDFYKKDLRHEHIKVAQLHGQTVSQDNLTFVVHGGTRDRQMGAYQIAQELDEEGKNVALIIGADSDKNPDTVMVEIYSKGATQYYVFAHNNLSMADYKKALRDQALKAYNDE